MAGASALEGLEPGVLQALVGRGGHWLASSLTQLLLKHIEGCLRGCLRDTGASTIDTSIDVWQLRHSFYLVKVQGLHALANCCSADALFCDQLACKFNQLLAETSVIILRILTYHNET